MGDLFGLPEWLKTTILVITAIAVLFAFAWRNTKRQIARTLRRRSNPTRDEFLALMAVDVSPAASTFLWDTAYTCLKPHLTPHPDDDLIKDLPIDADDVSMDWPREWAESQGFHESNLADWPEGWPVTVRNYGRWLDMCPQP